MQFLKGLLPNLPLLSLRSYATKNKTNKSASKRFFKLASGGYAHQSSCRNHNFAKKATPYRQRHRLTLITSPSQTRKLDKMYA